MLLVRIDDVHVVEQQSLQGKGDFTLEGRRYR